MKATSKVGVFRADDQLLAGVVVFKAGKNGSRLLDSLDMNVEAADKVSVPHVSDQLPRSNSGECESGSEDPRRLKSALR